MASSAHLSFYNAKQGGEKGVAVKGKKKVFCPKKKKKKDRRG